jgi:uncharacterized protein YcfJ
MKTIHKTIAAAAAALACGAACADVTFYERDNFGGRSFTARNPIEDFHNFGFNDRASSVVVSGEPWEVCEDVVFRGHCVLLRPGNYPSLGTMNLNDRVSSAREVDRHARWTNDQYAPAPLPGQITFYENDAFQGRSFNATSDIPNFRRYGFNDRASSVVVLGDRWEACEDPEFGGRCIFLRPGRYPNLASMGMNDRVSSVRLLLPGMRTDESRWAPAAPPAYDYRARPQEPIYTAPVSYSHAVYANAGQHCWVDHEQVPADKRRNQVAGAAIGGILGGVLGHQIGGNNTGTIAGALGGAVLGGLLGNNVNSNVASRDVQRCEPNQVSGTPTYWDTAYTYRGVEHHVQTTSDPGPTIPVNANGEPRS